MKNKRLFTFITAVVMMFSVCTTLPMKISVPLETSASGVDNIAARADYLYNITWKAQKTVNGWRNNYTFTQGNTYHIPYGQPVSSGKYVYWGVSIDDFLSATQNASSEFYSTRSYYSGNSGSYSTYYAMDCSALASYCWGLSNRTTTSSWSSLPVTSYEKCTSANVNKIQVGDALNLAGSHIVIVSDVTYDSSGNITQVEITEQTPPETKRSYYTASSLVSKYSSYTIYRYNKRDSVTPPPILPNDKKWYDGMTPVNMGDCFTAYIINTAPWKHLTSEDNGNVIMTSETRKAEQMWQFTRKSNGSYKIINCKTGKALDAGGTEGNLYTYDSCDNSWQSWYIYGSSGEYYLKSQESDYVIDIVGGFTDDGTNAQIYEYNGTDAQKFQIYMIDETGNLGTIQNLGDKFTAYIINSGASKNLVVEDNDNVVIETETGKAEQMWQFTRKSDGSYTILNCKTGKALDAGGTEGNLYTYESCDNDWQSWYIFKNSEYYFLKSQGANEVIDITGGYTGDGTNARIYKANGTSAQKFQIYMIDETGNFGTIQNLGDKFTAYIINSGASKNLVVEDNDNVVIKTETGKAEQMWQFVRKPDGSYTIINCKTGKVLDAGGTDGNLYTYDSCDNDWQSWYIFGTLGTYYLKSERFNDVIDVTGGYTDDGTNVQMYKLNNTDAQKFQIYVLDETGNLGVIQNLGDDFTAYITNVNSSKNLTEDDNNVIIRTETKNAEQIWRFIRKSDGSYIIANCKTGRVLDSGGTDGNLYTYEDCDNDWQNWYIFGSSGAYYLKSKRFNDVIDVTGGYTDNGTNAQMYKFNNTDAQKFDIKETILFGDANNDKQVNIADAVMLQKWLLGLGTLTDWKCVDLCEDGRIDVFDMIEMRKLIVNK